MWWDSWCKASLISIISRVSATAWQRASGIRRRRWRLWLAYPIMTSLGYVPYVPYVACVALDGNPALEISNAFFGKLWDATRTAVAKWLTNRASVYQPQPPVYNAYHWSLTLCVKWNRIRTIEPIKIVSLRRPICPALKLLDRQAGKYVSALKSAECQAKHFTAKHAGRRRQLYR